MPAVINFESQNGSIKQWATGHGDTNNPQYTYSSLKVQAEKAANKDAEGAEVNGKVALRDLETRFYQMEWMDPTLITVEGVACANVADFMTWFSGVQAAALT
jgi:hypothetical protein